VVITDGRSKGVYNVTTESIDLHNSNIEIFAVGIRSDTSITELKAIASSASHVFNVKDFHHLHLALHNIWCGEYKDWLRTLISSPTAFSAVRVTRTLVLCIFFVDRCLSLGTFSFGHWFVCSSSIYGFWLPLWYLQTLLTYISK
jgi:hypothetical protein